MLHLTKPLNLQSASIPFMTCHLQVTAQQLNIFMGGRMRRKRAPSGATAGTNGMLPPGASPADHALRAVAAWAAVEEGRRSGAAGRGADGASEEEEGAALGFFERFSLSRLDPDPAVLMLQGYDLSEHLRGSQAQVSLLRRCSLTVLFSDGIQVSQQRGAMYVCQSTPAGLPGSGELAPFGCQGV